MREFFIIILKFRFFIFFFILETIALVISFSNSKLIQNVYYGSSHYIIGNIYENIYKIQDFLLLKIENQKLIEENTRLHNENILSKIDTISKDFKKEDVNYLQEYVFTPVKIINNSIHEKENYLTINKGSINGVYPDMGIIFPNGIGGIIIKTTKHFSTAISILNSKIKVNARLKKNKYFGILSWDGIDYKHVILYDIPKYCLIHKGDLVETDGKSSTFPEGIPIGTVDSYKFDEENSSYVIKVRLFSNFYTVGNAYVVKNLLKKEWDSVHIVENKE
ncbi:rod shape-determining protein MreC [Blattabacterium cuenoti]|uniref:rod shape-determining protein MreC n=1 Tax=Blattabacterium cuenoti TaxID=1653831 RepID=UPI00163C48BA|nr:rod shape-determining protein MreC [Blattabacterium cuenoti]